MIDRHRRLELRRIVVVCPPGPACSVRATARSRRLPPARFAIPGGRSSRVRLHVTGNPRKLAGRRVAVVITARAGAGERVTRSFLVKIRRRVLHHRRPARPKARPPALPRPPLGAAPPLVGISDQAPGTFADPLFTVLRMPIARVIVPWNVMAAAPDKLAAWLLAAAAAHVEPMIAVEHATADRCPASPCRLPSGGDYAAQLRALLARFPWVRVITPWNEPNHASQPTAAAPARAAGYYAVARAVCPSCTLVAGDLLDASSLEDWLRTYRAALPEEPAVWGLHDYFDTTYLRDSGVAAMLATVRGELWLTETGGIVSHRGGLPPDEERARRAVDWALRLAAAHADRVRRVYVYQWRAAPDASFDAGLLRPDGTPRPAYELLADRVQPPPATPAAGSPPTISRPRVRGRRASVSVACAAACSGTVVVESRVWATALLLNGLPRGYLTPPRRAAFRLAAGGRATLALRLAARPRTPLHAIAG